MASSVLRSDFTLYMVLGYLLLFRLDELGFGEFRRLSSSEDPTKMAQLLNYLIDWDRVEVRSEVAYIYTSYIYIRSIYIRQEGQPVLGVRTSYVLCRPSTKSYFTFHKPARDKHLGVKISRRRCSTNSRLFLVQRARPTSRNANRRCRSFYTPLRYHSEYFETLCLTNLLP